jgi:hypothetical protein
MKRNLLLILAIFGMTFIYWSCEKEPQTCTDSNASRVIDLTSISFYETTTGGPIYTPLDKFDSKKWDNVVLSVGTLTELIAKKVTTNDAVYAELPPKCKWSLDSIRITRSGKDITELFTLNGIEMSEAFRNPITEMCGLMLYPKSQAANDKLDLYKVETYDQMNGKLEVVSDYFKIIK